MTEKLSFRWRLFTWMGGYIGCATILSTFLGCIIGGVIGFGLGALRTSGTAYYQQYLEEKELIEPILASDPAFGDVRVHQRSSGGIFMTGNVPTATDRARLRERIIRLVGEKRADEIMLVVGPYSK